MQIYPDMNTMKLIPLWLIAAITLLSSCKTKNNLVYFEDLQQTADGIIATEPYNVKIEPESELLIFVKSEVPAASAEFNLPYINPATEGTTTTSSIPTQQTYKVDENGDIDFPRLGKIHVAGMTQMQLKEYLIKRISEYVKDPMVTVKMLGYKIIVMGEVNAPKSITTTAERYSLLDAIADCGGMNTYAVRDNLLLLRRNEKNEYEHHKIDMTRSDIMQSPYFWLKNNDVVIIQPNDKKAANANFNQEYGYKLSMISTIVSACSTVASLVVALIVK